MLVAAQRRELAGFRRRLRDAERLDWPLDCALAGRLGGDRFVLVANGAGARLAAEALAEARSRTTVGVVVSAGFCGALDPALGPGAIFVASQVCAAGGGPCYPARLPRTSRAHAVGTLLSADWIVQSRQEKRQLRESGGDAVDMEAAGVAECAAAWGLPFYCVRAVTDTAEESFRCDINAARLPDGRVSDWKLVRDAFRHPAERLPELWRLWRRAGQAAETLGEFLAGCRF